MGALLAAPTHAAGPADPPETEEPARLTLVERPSITGAARYTRTLTADRGVWRPRPEKVAFHWLRDGEPIKGARDRRYRLAAADVGSRISVRVTARRAGYQATSADSARTRRVRHRVGVRRTVTYRVETRGRITTSLKKFRTQAQQTFADARGWRSGGTAFRPVRRGGDFTLVLSEARRVPDFSSGCSAQWSCRVGRYVIINQDRWKYASQGWRAANGSLRDYRHMVVNHETGHWLGLGHRGCSGRGNLAPVMMQQSKGLDGCRFNPWPVASELRASR
ncbi:DUF3152 domain-containing protein [Nocardioides pacificus]